MPFSDERATAIYEAVRTVLEDAPYYWKVVRADDNVEQPGLWDNLKAKLIRAHCYVAILTGDVNPNVMIEIGRMEALERPLLLLRDASAPDLPVDLHGRLFEVLHASGSDLLGEVREVLARQDALRRLGGRTRYLSEAVLVGAGFGDRVSREISRRYPTWEEFLQTDSDQVARQLGVSKVLVDAAKDALAKLDD